MMKRFVLLFTTLFLAGCSSSRMISSLKENMTGAILNPSFRNEVPEIEHGLQHRDTLKVEAPDGHEVLIMKAIRDEDGDMVATDVLDAAVVTARFRNVAERNGLVDIAFDVTVPKMMQYSKWQIRLYPEMEIMGEMLELDPVIITGKDYRKGQLRGYQQYEKFLSSIITDSTRFIRTKDLEYFLKRNIPEIYAFKSDTSFVSEEAFFSHWGVSQQEAIQHYTNRQMIRRNDLRIGKKDMMYQKFVKVPILKEGIRLDSVMVNPGTGDFVYEYIQTIKAKAGLRKVGLSMKGSIFEEENEVYSIPESDPLTFYISSLSTLTDNTERYLTRVIERRVSDNTSCRIEFASADSQVDLSLSGNAEEVSRIKRSLRSLLENKEFDLDSILVSASCSPEGSYSFNERLSRLRSESVSRYFEEYLDSCRDSLRKEEGVVINLDQRFHLDEIKVSDIKFISRSNPENWTTLEKLIEKDTVISFPEKERIQAIMKEADPDARENLLSTTESYEHIRMNLYPKLRSVRFDFHLHRKGMVKDTVHTTVIDTVYMMGVQAIKDRDYEKAVTLLRPYRDFNTAIAFCSMEYNASALDILESLETTDKSEYMKAILYSRSGDDALAVQHYLKACDLNPSFVHRGNLDPEISSLIGRYNVHIEEEEDDQQGFL